MRCIIEVQKIVLKFLKRVGISDIVYQEVSVPLEISFVNIMTIQIFWGTVNSYLITSSIIKKFIKENSQIIRILFFCVHKNSWPISTLSFHHEEAQKRNVAKIK